MTTTEEENTAALQPLLVRKLLAVPHAVPELRRAVREALGEQGEDRSLLPKKLRARQAAIA